MATLRTNAAPCPWSLPPCCANGSSVPVGTWCAPHVHGLSIPVSGRQNPCVRGDGPCPDSQRGESPRGETPRPWPPRRPGPSQAWQNRGFNRLASRGVFIPAQVYGRFLSFSVIPFQFLSFLVTSCHFLSLPVISCHFLSFLPRGLGFSRLVWPP